MCDEGMLIQLANIASVGHLKGGNKVPLLSPLITEIDAK